MAGGDHVAEVFVEDRASLSLRLEDGKIEEAVSGVDRGGSVRVIRGLSTRFGYVDSVEESSLLALAGELSRSQPGTGATEAPTVLEGARCDPQPLLVGAASRRATVHPPASALR